MNRKTAFGATIATALALAILPRAAQAAPARTENNAPARCEALSGLRLPNTTITEATFVAAEPATRTVAGAKDGHRAFCRIVAHVRSDPDSDIGVELWLPAQGWAGVFHGNGNGGFGGSLAAGYSGMVDGLRRGFATATTDTGTAPASPFDGDALVGHPRKWRDWGRLSTHVMTVTGKAVTKAFYGREAKQSFYTGCSTGGQQGLIEALYYPADYDGILVGAPVINRTWGHAAVLWDYAAAHRTPGSALSPAKLALLNRAAIAACWEQGDALAGDRFISDPLACRFDPAILRCKTGASETCLTDQEVATAEAFYSGPTGRDGSPAFYGWLPGSEVPGLFGWSFLQTPIHGEPPFAGLFKWVFGDEWKWQDFDFDRDMPLVDDRLGGIVNDATRGSLRTFFARGGKLMMFHGLADTLVPPAQSMDFFKRQTAEVGKNAMAESARLYLAPGMMHCGGGTGPDSFNATLGIPPQPPARDRHHEMFSALIDWTDGRSTPESIIATKFAPSEPSKVEMQRPLCPYPEKARYVGAGSTDAPANFECR